MPKQFDECVKNGGRVRTIRGPNKKYGLSAGQYRHVCFIGGEMSLGHVKTKKKD